MLKVNTILMTLCCILGISGCSTTAPQAASAVPTKPAVSYLHAEQAEVMNAPNFTYELSTSTQTLPF